MGIQFNNGFTNLFSNKAVVYDLDENGNVAFDTDGSAIKSDKRRNALTNCFALTVGLFF